MSPPAQPTAPSIGVKPLQRSSGTIVPAIPLVFSQKQKSKKPVESVTEHSTSKALWNGNRLGKEALLDDGGKEVVASSTDRDTIAFEHHGKSNASESANLHDKRPETDENLTYSLANDTGELETIFVPNHLVPEIPYSTAQQPARLSGGSIAVPNPSHTHALPHIDDPLADTVAIGTHLGSEEYGMPQNADHFIRPAYPPHSNPRIIPAPFPRDWPHSGHHRTLSNSSQVESLPHQSPNFPHMPPNAQLVAQHFGRTPSPYSVNSAPPVQQGLESLPLGQHTNMGNLQYRENITTESKNGFMSSDNAHRVMSPPEPLFMTAPPLKHTLEANYAPQTGQGNLHAMFYTVDTPISNRDSQAGPYNTAAAPYGYPPDEMRELTEYLQAQFQNPSTSDLMITLCLNHAQVNEAQFVAHSLLAARSPTLKRTMESSQSNHRRGQQKMIRLETSDRFIRPDAFGLALWRLYGGYLLNFEDFSAKSHFSRSPPSLQLDKIAKEHQLSFILAYTAAGSFLQIPSVSERGLYLIVSLINWLTVETIFDFVLEGGLRSEGLDEDDAHQFTSQHTRGNSMTVEPGSVSNSVAIEKPLYGTLADALLHELLEFVIHGFPKAFRLYSSAFEPGLLPSLSNGGSTARATPKTKPGFIQFGDVENDNNPGLGQNIIVLSKILLSLPFNLLKTVLESKVLGDVDGWISPDMRKEVMESVVSEREARRLAAIDAIHRRPQQPNDNSALERLGWKESVIASEGPGQLPSLHQEWIRLTT